MKKTFISLVSLLAVMSASGQTRLNVTLKSGSSLWYQMQDTKIAFEGSQVILTEKGGTRNTFSFNDLAKITLSETPASVENVSKPLSLSVYTDGTELRFKGGNLDDDQMIAIYNLNGQRVFTAKQSLNTPVQIAHLSKGIYLIRTQNQTIKFIK